MPSNGIYRVAGLRTYDFDVPETVEAIARAANDRRPVVYAFVNAHSAILRRSEPDYADLLESPGVVPVSDGSSMTLGARLFGVRLKRSPGPDVFEASAATAARSGQAFYLLGSSPETCEKLAQALVQRHPGLHIAGFASPPFGPWSAEDTQRMIEQVRASGADVLWLGVSAPKQEIWAAENAERLGIPIVCVGAAFDFLSGSKGRAPEWVRRMGLEWVHRLASEPGRLWHRYLIGNTRYAADLVRYRVERVESEAALP